MSDRTSPPEEPGGPAISAGPETQPGYGTGPGYAQPGPGVSYPAAPARRRWPMWLGIGAGFVVLVILIAGVSAYLLARSKTWTVSAPQGVAGMTRDTSPADEQGFRPLVAKFRSDVTSLRGYGSLTSTVSGIYRLGPGQAVGLIGFNGTFKVQVVLKTSPGLTVSTVNPGPHGGPAECGAAGPHAVCQWSTGSTVGIVVVMPTSPAAGPVSVNNADRLMIRIRDSAERQAHAG